MKKKLLALSLCSVLFLTAGCGQVAKLKNGQELVAQMDGKDITTEDLYKELKGQGGTTVLINMIDDFIANKEIKTDETAKEYANSQLEQLKLQYSQSGQDFTAALKGSGYASEDAFKDTLILDYKKNKVAENYLKDNLTEKEMKAYYEDEVFGDLTVRHILIKADTTTSMTDDEKSKAEEKAEKEAEDIIKKLEDGKKFEDLAKEYSDDEGTKKDGGLLKDFSKDSVVTDFWDASYKLKDKEYTKTPVKSEYGYHVILRVSAKDKEKYKDIKDEIKSELVSKRLTEDTNLSKKTWDKIRSKYKLSIKDSELKSTYDKTIKELSSSSN